MGLVDTVALARAKLRRGIMPSQLTNDHVVT